MTTPLPENFRVPAEWENQETVYLAASPANEFDPSHFASPNKTVMDVHLSMVEGLLDHVKVKIIADKIQAEKYTEGMKAKGIDPARVEFISIPHCDIWLRDTGPIWAHSDKEIAAIWMGFNNWGYYDFIEGSWATCDIPNFIPRNLANHLGVPVYRTSLVGEGGDKSFNGEGSLICCKAVEKDRNPQLSFQEIKNLLRSSFNISNIIWVERGLADDVQSFRVYPEYRNANLPGGIFTPLCTGGHIDEYCRFVGPSKILLARVHENRLNKMSPIEEITHFNLEGDLQMLREQRDQEGKELEIVRMPLPPNMIYAIDLRDPIYAVLNHLRGVKINSPIKVVLAGSYCNYLVSNGVVCFPQYYHEGLDPELREIDHEAMEIIQSVFPDHKIIPIDPRPVNAGGGGMHCISNNQPGIS